MKKLLKTTIAIGLLVFLFSAAFNYGKKTGFRNGSEWAILQAEIVAREAGMALPVYLHDGAFRVVFRQPPGLYKKAWQLADRFDRENKAGQAVKQESGKAENTHWQTEF